MSLEIPRRKFIIGLVGLFCAPAIVKADSLMKIVAPPLAAEELPIITGPVDYSMLAAVTRKAFIPSVYVSLYKSHPLLSLFAESARGVA